MIGRVPERRRSIAIPTQAGTHPSTYVSAEAWVPACAGMVMFEVKILV
jgi:hypothetical protein